MRRFWPPPIWMHLTLTILVTAACFFGGAIGGASLFGARSMAAAGAAGSGLDSSCAGAAFFFGGAVVGLAAGQLLMTCWVPARCPNCGGRTYYRGGRPITYHCRDCRHVHATSVSDSQGGWDEGARRNGSAAGGCRCHLTKGVFDNSWSGLGRHTWVSQCFFGALRSSSLRS